jgi:hypothetical protein
MEATFHILSGGNDQPALLLPVLRRLQREAARYSEPEATLALFVTIWPVASQYAELRRQIAWHAKNLAERMCAGRGAVSKASLPPLPAGVAELWTLAGTFLFRACFSADARKEIDTLSGLFVEASLPEGATLSVCSRTMKHVTGSRQPCGGLSVSWRRMVACGWFFSGYIRARRGCRRCSSGTHGYGNYSACICPF